VWVADTHQVLGVIAVADTVRPEALSMVAKLKKLGIEKVVLTGDNSGRLIELLKNLA